MIPVYRSAPPEAPAAGSGLRRLCIAGGGTGGHLMPGLALAERARERFPGVEVTFFRTRRAIEDQVFAEQPGGGEGDMVVRELDLPPPGRSPPAWARFFRRCLLAEKVIRTELRRSPPGVLVALGGYPSLPGIIAAKRERVPVVLLEQNRSPGKVVRRLSRWATAVACPDGEAAARLLAGRHESFERRGTRVVVTGNPLRRAIIQAMDARAARRALRARRSDERRTVVVLGGSQGSRGINRAIREALPSLQGLARKLSWIHLTGNADKDAMVEAYRSAGFEARVLGYSNQVPAFLAQADLAVARAGGTTVSELSAVGVPAILVPYPHHADRHQFHNAEALVQSGAARLVPEEELGPERIAELFRELLFDEARLAAMEEAALSLARPEAADLVLDLILQVSGEA
jgi:UDP-N-acetylglucosamine--N-acetylmuramyl-(pentapeptide) pyrophosphoryl-undecaprenol N-acetylglucosamine transferase